MQLLTYTAVVCVERIHLDFDRLPGGGPLVGPWCAWHRLWLVCRTHLWHLSLRGLDPFEGVNFVFCYRQHM